MTAELSIHLVELVAVIFWIGVSYGDLRWLKSELRYLRGKIDAIFGQNAQQHSGD